MTEVELTMAKWKNQKHSVRLQAPLSLAQLNPLSGTSHSYTSLQQTDAAFMWPWY